MLLYICTSFSTVGFRLSWGFWEFLCLRNRILLSTSVIKPCASSKKMKMAAKFSCAVEINVIHLAFVFKYTLGTEQC